MRGQILGVDQQRGVGLVAGDDGQRYAFRPEDWAQPGEPAIGLYVDFETEGDSARSLFAVPGANPQSPVVRTAPRPRNDRNKIVAAVLAFLLGTLGVHRFYLGRTGSGIAMLVLTCTVIGLLV
ncbi:MAG: TM2 domain-containing protein, partial [Sphingomonas bacterium]|nr:TM2 domain-containing protein [Sphingomonas bacterium]